MKKKPILFLSLFLVCCLLFSGCHWDGLVFLPSSSSSQDNSSGSSEESSSSETIDSEEESSSTMEENSSSIDEPDESSSKNSGSSKASVSSKTSPSSSGNGTSSVSKPEPVSSAEPQPKVVRVTIPEGYSFMQIAQTLENKGVCSQKEFYEACQSYTVKSFTIPVSASRCFRLEGYLFPDTYEFYLNDNPENVIRKMLNNYAAKSGMPSDETLILASIIEREARSSGEMAKVSSVFHNRLAAGMRLDADPTREYVNNYITNNPLVANSGSFAALYNTYKCSGLPAGPICSPSTRAIQAALHPADTDYLYFFFGMDNQNHYSTTLEEHEQKMKEIGVQGG